MAQLLQTSITGSISSTGSLIISGSEPVQLPLLNSGSGEIDLTTPYQLWFDNGDNYVKYHVKGAYQAGAWSAATPLITGRDALVGAGEQIAGIVYGGSEPSVSNKTEEYNGLTWSNGGNLITARLNISKGFGTQNAAMAAGGRTPSIVTCGEEYNGTSWSAGGNLITARRTAGAAGTQNAGLVFGGATPSVVACTEEYNGTSFATGGVMGTARCDLAGGGTQNSGVAFGGATPTVSGATEYYNGTSWASSGNMNSARLGLSGGADCSFSAVAFNGFINPANVKCTENFDGTSWSVGAATIDGFRARGGAGTAFSAFVAGGESPTTNLAEEWTRPYVPPFTCTISYTTTYATCAGLSTNRYQLGSSGTTSTSALAFGGSTSPGASAATEEYNGSSWSNGGNLIIARRHNAGSSCGSVNSALSFGGTSNPTSLTSTEQYDGTSWTAKNCMITGRQLLGGAGDVDSALAIGGFSTTPTTATYGNTEEFNGTSWSAGGALITGRQKIKATGAQNAALAFGGQNPGYKDLTEEYNGSTWSTGGSMSQAASSRGATGIQNAALAMGGYPTSEQAAEIYDGTSWSTLNDSPNEITSGGSAGKVAGALFYGKFNQSNSTCLVVGGGNEVNLATYKCNLPSAWSTGGATIVAGYGARAGIQNSYSSVGPYNDTEAHENYNGTSWSSATDVTYSVRSMSGAGADADNTVIFGGFPTINTTVEWNGSSWATCGAMNAGRVYHTGVGTQNDAGTVAGYIAPAYKSCHENYGGATWSTATALPITAGLMASAGAGADDHMVGNNDAGAGSCNAYLWNGSAWSTLANVPSGTRYARQGNGATTNAAMFFGGSIPNSPYAPQTDTDVWNGTSWSSDADMLLGGDMGYGSGAGATTSAGIAGPRYDVVRGYSSCVEEFNLGDCVFSNLHCKTRCLDATCTQI